jgi:hypothetical protein
VLALVVYQLFACGVITAATADLYSSFAIVGCGTVMGQWCNEHILSVAAIWFDKLTGLFKRQPNNPPMPCWFWYVYIWLIVFI